MLNRRTFLQATGLAGLAVAATGMTAAEAFAAPALTARVMTFNIMLASKTANQVDPTSSNNAVPDSDVYWPNRADRMMDWIGYENPDIVGMQENYSFKDKPQIETVRSAIEQTYQIVRSTDTNPILVRKAKYQVLGSGQFQINWKGKDGSRFNRYCTWAKLTDLPTGRTVYSFNTHTHPYQEDYAAKARSKGYDALIAGMKLVLGVSDLAVAAPWWLTGDFNARSDETRSVYRDHLTKLPAAGIVPAHARPGATETSEIMSASSYNGYGIKLGGRWRYHAIRTYGYQTPEKKSGQEGYLYDYVWTQAAASVTSWRVCVGPGKRSLKADDGKYYPFFAHGPIPSDHNPMLANLTF